MHALPILLAVMLPVAPLLAAPIQATLGERSSGFSDLAECRAALGGDQAPRGSVFNRAHGNISRCEMIEGEARIVVIPRGHGAKTQ